MQLWKTKSGGIKKRMRKEERRKKKTKSGGIKKRMRKEENEIWWDQKELVTTSENKTRDR